MHTPKTMKCRIVPFVVLVVDILDKIKELCDRGQVHDGYKDAVFESSSLSCVVDLIIDFLMSQYSCHDCFISHLQHRLSLCYLN